MRSISSEIATSCDLAALKTQVPSLDFDELCPYSDLHKSLPLDTPQQA